MKVKKKLLALLLAVVMVVSMIPVMSGFTDKDHASVNVGEWLTLVNQEFGMSYYEQTDPYFANITADNTYFAAVQTAVEWNVISKDDNIDVLEAVKTDFMAATLAAVAKLDGQSAEIENANSLYHPELVAIAVSNGLVTLKNGKLDNAKITLSQGKDVLAAAKQLWATKSFADDEKANVTPSDDVKDLSSIQPTANMKDKYVVENTFEDNGVEKQTITLPGTDATASLAQGDVIVLPATSENPFGAVKEVTEVVSNDVPFSAIAADEAQGTVTVECQQADINNVFDTIDLQSDFAPDFNTAQVIDEEGTVLNSPDASATDGFSLADSGIATMSDETVMLSLLRNEDSSKLLQCASASSKPVEIDFSVGDYAVKGSIDGDKMDFMVSAVINGTKVTKTYNFSNFNLSTKADISVARAKIKEAYIRVDYDVVDSTKLEGNYSANLAEYNAGKEATITDVDSLLGTDIYGGLQGAADKLSTSINNTFKIASVEIPIPNMPVVSIALDISLKLNVDGSIELVIESNNSRGYEIINNQGRVINNTVNKENKVNLGADCQLTANFGLSLKLLGLTVVDAGVETGIGVDTDATVMFFKANGEVENNVTADIPIEVALVLTEGDTYANVTGKITVYGILTCSVGQNSPILSKIGLSRTWEVFNKDNAVIFVYDFNEGNIPTPEQVADDTITVPESSTPVPTTASVETIELVAGKTVSVADKGKSFASSDTAVAVVDANGTVTAVASGKAKITVTTADGSVTAYDIVVTDVNTTNTVTIVSAYQSVAKSVSI